jgi:hypothetical protein
MGLSKRLSKDWERQQRLPQLGCERQTKESSFLAMMQALQGIMMKIITMGLWYLETDELICLNSDLHFSPQSIYDSSFSMKTAKKK